MYLINALASSRGAPLQWAVTLVTTGVLIALWVLWRDRFHSFESIPIKFRAAFQAACSRWIFQFFTSSIYGNRSYESTVRWGPVNGTSAGKRRNLYPGSLHSLFVLCQLVPMLSQRASTMTSQCSSSTTVQRALTSIHNGQLALGQLAFMIINVRLFRLDEHPSPDQWSPAMTNKHSQYLNDLQFESAHSIRLIWGACYQYQEQAWYLVLVICKPLASQLITKHLAMQNK